MNKTYILALFVLVVIFSAGTDACGQRNKKKKELATVKGRIVQNEDPNLRLPYNDLNIRLVEQIRLPIPETPPEFKDWPPEKRKKWIDDFEASPEGKKLIERRKKLHDAANTFDIKVEKNGKFIVYDVPPGRYGMHGRADKKIDNKLYAFEVFGQIEVREEVDQLDLGRMVIATTRLVSRGEKTPNIELETFDGIQLSNDDVKGKFVVVYFWSMASPATAEFLPVVKKLQSEFANRPNFELLSVNLDDDRDAALKFMNDNGVEGLRGYAGDWEHKTVTEFGVRAIPALFLLGDNGKVLMTRGEFLQAFQAGKDDLTNIVDDRIAGRDTPDAKSPTEKNGDE